MLELAMLSIENNVKDESKKVQEISISEANARFFSEIRQNKDKYLLKSTNNNVQLYENKIIKQVIADYPFKKDETLSDDETIILKSYFKCVKNENIDKVLLTQYYLDKINKLNVDERAKYRCNACLSFIRDALIVGYDEKIVAPRLKTSTYEYSIGTYVSIFEDCLRRCISRKLNAIFIDGNWVDQAFFIVQAPQNVLMYTTSCTVSCS
jgi:Pyruvate/2-oxoacid:ferredoxin oxidoreductase delta subunit